MPRIESLHPGQDLHAHRSGGKTPPFGRWMWWVYVTSRLFCVERRCNGYWAAKGGAAVSATLGRVKDAFR